MEKIIYNVLVTYANAYQCTLHMCWTFNIFQYIDSCNSNIHTSISHFMEIQQKETESLATYIHHFKKEAKKCNFTNYAVNIRIFVKELKNMHSLAVWIYEKGPQTLADAISEVQKLQAAQQLTVTLILSSTVNIMSHEDDHCFQCQESGHIACLCPTVQCFECDEYRHIVMDCPHRIQPLGTPAWHHRSKSWHRHHNRSTWCHCHEDRHKGSRSRSQSHHQRHHSQSHHNSYRGHSRSHHRDSRWHHRSNSQCSHSNTYIHCSHCNTPHRRSSSHRSSSAYSWDHSRSCSQSSCRPAKRTLHQNSSHSRRSQGNTQMKRNSSHNRWSTNGLLPFRWQFQWFRGRLRPFKLVEPSVSSTPHECGGQIQRKKIQWHVSWIAPLLQSMP